MRADLPAGTVLQEKVDVVLCFREVSELDNVAMVNGFPSFDFVLECVDEVLLGETLVFAEVDLVNQMLFLNHFTGQHCSLLRVERKVGLCETAFPQFLILYLVASIHHLDRVNRLDFSLVCLVFTLHLEDRIIMKKNRTAILITAKSHPSKNAISRHMARSHFPSPY